MKRIISTPKAPQAIGPYSQAVEAKGTLYCSGQIPLDPATGEMVKGDVVVQAERVLENLKGVIEAAGYSLSDVVKCTVYLTSLGDFSKVNEVYGRYFGSEPPARVCVEVPALPRGAEVEIDAIAVR